MCQKREFEAFATHAPRAQLNIPFSFIVPRAILSTTTLKSLSMGWIDALSGELFSETILLYKLLLLYLREFSS